MSSRAAPVVAGQSTRRISWRLTRPSRWRTDYPHHYPEPQRDRHLLRQGRPDRQPVQAVHDLRSALAGQTVASVTALNSAEVTRATAVTRCSRSTSRSRRSPARRRRERSTSSSPTGRSRMRSATRRGRCTCCCSRDRFRMGDPVPFCSGSWPPPATAQAEAAASSCHAAEKEYQALHDPLTGLPNRALFSRADPVRAPRRPSGASRGRRAADGPRPLQGDQRHARAPLRRPAAAGARRPPATALRESDTVARLGGDEFGVLLPSTPRPPRGQRGGRADPQPPSSEPFILQGLPLASRPRSASRSTPTHGEDVDTLVQRADVAMYQAKATNALFEVYDERRDEYDPRRLTLVGELRRAIERGRARRSTTSRRRCSGTATSTASRRSCAGSTRSAASCRRTSSSRSPSTPG